ncbi:MAG: phosphate ABC transporter, permease protein PstA [Gammaproteobacteria bacterium HGW-Gammaproteobacteria-11]|nr:MAG: phosphate ABC transporter, permease protein PstA [Gammaproteobacteria bacterium HGW-Gammaproteobacteria-11]
MAERLFTLTLWLIVGLVCLAFLWLLGDVLVKGLPAISWEFLSQAPSRAGRQGGIWPILVSTLLILSVAISVALPLGLCSAIWLAEFTRRGGAAGQRIGLVLDILAGVPSIVIGLFGYAFFSGFLGLGFSILSGGLTLACMMLPILVRTAESGLNAVSDDWRQAGAALAMRRSSVLWHVLLPAAAPAITAGVLLAIGRATAETAALIFTSGYVDRMPESLSDSGRALAVHIYDLSMNITGGDQAAYGSAVVLVTLIVLINLVANQLSLHWAKRKVTLT